MTVKERLRPLSTSLFAELPRFILIAFFSLAAIDKVTHFRGFLAAIISYQLLPTKLEYFAAIFFIMAEFGIALGLLTSRWRQRACLAAVLLLGILTLVYLTVKPVQVCGPWLTLTLNSGGYFYILQNLVFIALAILTWMDHKAAKPDPLSEPYSTSTSTAESDDGRLKHA